MLANRRGYSVRLCSFSPAAQSESLLRFLKLFFGEPMKLDHVMDLLDTAAASTLAQIRRDRQRAPARVSQFLTLLEQEVFTTKLSVSKLMQTCGIRDRAFSTAFSAALGLSPDLLTYPS